MKKFKVWFGHFLFLGMIFPSALLAQSEGFADQLYLKKDYTLARLEYERVLRSNPYSEITQSKLALSHLREKDFRKALDALRKETAFAPVYIRMYASMRAGLVYQSVLDDDYISNGNFSDSQKEHSRLMAGTIYLEEGSYASAKEHYEALAKNAKNPEVKAIANDVLNSMTKYAQVPRKSPWLATSMSAVIPGSGQVYAGHEIAGITAFFFNVSFLGGAIALHDLENQADRPHIASSILGVVGLFFYLTNLTGAYASAKRWNIHHEREFQQDIRERFFHLDFVEKSSGIVFKARL